MWVRQTRTMVRTVGTALAVTLVAASLATTEQARRAGDAVPVVSASPAQVAFESAAATGEPVEIPGEGDEYAVRLANPDGTVTTELSSVPVRVRTDDGGWEQVDYTLHREGGRVVPVAGDQEVSFSAGGNAPLVDLASSGEALSLGWLTSLPSPELAGSTATYRNVLPDVDLLMTAVPGGYTQLFRVRSAAAAHNPQLDELQFSFDLSDGAVPVNRAAGGFDVVDDNGETVFQSAEARMWDSAGTEGSPANGSAGAGDVGTEEGDQIAPLDVTATNSELAVVPDQQLLEGANTVYPVFIDPHIVALHPTEWTMVQKEYPTTEFYEWSNSTWGDRGEGVGYQNDQGISTKRLMWEFDFGPLYDNSVIVDADFRVRETHSWSCTKAPVYLDRVGLIGPATNWSNQPAKINADHLASTSIQVRPPDGGPDGCRSEVEDVTFSSAALTTAIRDARQDGSRVALRLSATEASEVGWKRFRNGAVLTIKQNRIPDTPTDLTLKWAGSDKYGNPRTCGDAVSAVRTALPTIAGKVSDPDAEDTLDVNFDLNRWNRATSQWDNKANMWEPDNGNPAVVGLKLLPWMVDDASGALLGGHYRFTMRARDDSFQQLGPTSGPCDVFLDTDDPVLKLSAWINDLPGGGLRGLDTAAEQEEWLKGNLELTFLMDPGGSMGPRGSNDVDYYQMSSDVDALNGRWDPAAPGAEGRRTIATDNLAGEHWLTVVAVDEAGRISDPRRVLFRVLKAVQTGRYEFDEGEGTRLADSDPGAPDHAFTTTSGATFEAHPSSGHVLALDGLGGGAATAYPVMPSSQAAFSVSAWIRPDDVTQRRVVVSQENSAGQVYALAVEPECTCVEFSVTNPATGAKYAVRSANQVAAGRWTLVAGSFDDLALTNRIRAWVGSSAASLSFTGRAIPGFAPGTSASGRTLLGYEAPNAVAVNRWKGAIDDVRFYIDEVANLDLEAHIGTHNPNQ